ncbi:hypothetical protein P4O66_006515, partial [Electrophorus voltai]
MRPGVGTLHLCRANQNNSHEQQLAATRRLPTDPAGHGLIQWVLLRCVVFLLFG